MTIYCRLPCAATELHAGKRLSNRFSTYKRNMYNDISISERVNEMKSRLFYFLNLYSFAMNKY